MLNNFIKIFHISKCVVWMLPGKMCARAVMSPGSEHVNNPFLILWIRQTIPPEASNIKPWQPVNSLNSNKDVAKNSVYTQLAICGVELLLTLLQTKRSDKSRLESPLNPIGGLILFIAVTLMNMVAWSSICLQIAHNML